MRLAWLFSAYVVIGLLFLLLLGCATQEKYLKRVAKDYNIPVNVDGWQLRQVDDRTMQVAYNMTSIQDYLKNGKYTINPVANPLGFCSYNMKTITLNRDRVSFSMMDKIVAHELVHAYLHQIGKDCKKEMHCRIFREFADNRNISY